MSEQKFLFLDIETTGLDPDAHTILEFGAILTDEKFHELARFQSCIRPDQPLTEWDPWCVQQHIKSGLLQEASRQSSDLTVVLHKFDTWAHANGVDKNTMLAGSSIHFDIDFIERSEGGFLEWCEANISHRRLDLSAFRALDKATGRNLLPKNADEMPHTALADIEYDIGHAIMLRSMWLNIEKW